MADGLSIKTHARALHYHPDTTAWITRLIGHEPTGPELRELERRGVIEPDEIFDAPGNIATTTGVARWAGLFIGEAVQAFTTSRGVIGIGDGVTSPVVGDTDLSAAAGSTHRWFQGIDGTSPTRSGAIITINTTFASGDGNFTWAEWAAGIASAAPVASSVVGTALTAGILINHRVQAMGSKTAGGVSTHQATLTIA